MEFKYDIEAFQARMFSVMQVFEESKSAQKSNNAIIFGHVDDMSSFEANELSKALKVKYPDCEIIYERSKKHTLGYFFQIKFSEAIIVRKRMEKQLNRLQNRLRKIQSRQNEEKELVNKIAELRIKLNQTSII